MAKWELAVLAYYNDVIFREATRAGVPIIDLRLTCSEAGDYSTVSPIEPSIAGGAKIAAAIVRLLAEHDFNRGVTCVYA
jgi:hypothetical protein